MNIKNKSKLDSLSITTILNYAYFGYEVVNHLNNYVPGGTCLK